MTSARVLATDVLAAALAHDEGEPPLATAHAALGELGGLEFGLWEAGPGVDTDVETDEVFLVLSGEGTVSFEDGETVTLRPGVLVRLAAGERTRWEISTRLRKLYLA